MGNKKKNFIVDFFEKLFKKLDQKLEDKSKGCACCGNDKNKEEKKCCK
ncbi:MAG: hypothetical protein ABH857_05715 [Elusimicrobiota bacterium]